MTSNEEVSSRVTASSTRRRRRRADDDVAEEETLSIVDRWELESADDDEFQDNENGVNETLTVKLVDIVDTEHEQEYLEWQRGITSAMEEHVGRNLVTSVMLREAIAVPNKIRFVLLFRFATKAAAVEWHRSPVRYEWLDKLKESNFHYSNHNKMEVGSSSSEIFPIFTVEESTLQQKQRQQRWRTALLVWSQVFGLVELLGVLLPLTLGHVTWSSLSLHLQIAISTLITTLLIEFCTMRIFVRTAQFIRFLRPA